MNTHVFVVSLMNLGNSFTVRDDRLCLVCAAHYLCVCVSAGYCFFSYHGYPRAYQRRLSN